MNRSGRTALPGLALDDLGPLFLMRYGPSDGGGQYSFRSRPKQHPRTLVRRRSGGQDIVDQQHCRVGAPAARVRIDWLRRSGRAQDEPLDDELHGEALADAGPGGDPGEVTLERERAERVRGALERLPEPQRVVVHLHRFEEMGFAEIGKVLGITEGSARVRAFRAYARLRELLAGFVAEEPS